MLLRNSNFLTEILVLCTGFLRTCCKAPVDVKNAMKVHHVIPDVLDEAPDEMIDVIYPDGVCSDFGNQLNMITTLASPLVNWPSDGTGYFTLVMIDADFLLLPKKADPSWKLIRTEWRHWLIVNIQGSQFLTGQMLSEYLPPRPLMDHTLHRYVFVVFEQTKGKMQFHEPYHDVYNLNRGNFSIREFMQKYNFSNPMAINFFKADF